MNATQESAIAKLRAQIAEQPENSTPWYAGHQLIEMCSRDPNAAQILNEDLDNPEMSIVRAEAKIHAFADKIHADNKRGGSHAACVGISDADAERILRQFYGLPDANAPAVPDAQPSVLLSLADFL